MIKKVRRIKSLIESKNFSLDKFEYKNLTSNFVSKEKKLFQYVNILKGKLQLTRM